MEESDLESWENFNDLEKTSVIENIFLELSSEYKLNLKLDYRMTENFEEAFGNYDSILNIIYINKYKTFNEVVIIPLFTLLHEMRHAMHFINPKMFSPVIQKSQYYPILWDLNVAYKLCDGKYMECKLDYSKDYLEELCLLSPNEMDANVFAYEYIKTLLGDNKKSPPQGAGYFKIFV
jgi:hypothetical protein